MKKSTPIPETLAGMYHTDIPFLEGNKVPVIKRKFNWIPTGGKGDPPRALTDEPPLKTHFYDQHAVKSDFPKTMAYRMYGDGFKQFPDGTYKDAVLGLEEDYIERQKALKQVFAPSDVYQFMRADREQYAEEMMKDYFRSKYEEREEAEEMFLTNYGLLPHEVKTVMAQRRVEAAAKALQSAKTSDRIATHPMSYNLRREDFIATHLMDNTIPLFSADDVQGVGNAQPWAKGNEPWTRGYGEGSPYARMTSGAKSREERRESTKAIITAGKARMNAVMGITEKSDDVQSVINGSVSDIMTTAATVGGVERKAFTKDSIKQLLAPDKFKEFDEQFMQLMKTTESGIRQKRTDLVKKYPGLTRTMVVQAYGINKENFKSGK